MDTKPIKTMFVHAMYIMVVLAVALSVTGSASALPECSDPLGCVTIGAGDPIHIAYALTITGPNASLGIDSRNGIEIAIDDSGGQILGHDVLLTGEDEACSAEGGAAAGATLAADPTIVAVVGTSCSVAAREAMPLLSEAGFVMVSPSNTGIDLTEPGNPNNHPGYLRVSWSDKVQGTVAARFAREYLGISTAATVNDGSPYSVYLQQAFADEFTNLGGTITAQEIIDPGQTNMSTELTNIAAGAPEMLYFPIFMPEGGYIIDQARDTAGLETTYLLGSDALYTPDVVTAAGADVEGFMVTSPDFSRFSPNYFNHFLPAYFAKFGYDPISVFHAHAYDAFMMIKSAIEQVAVVDPDGAIQIGRQALRDALYGTVNFPGLTGNLTCSATGDCADPHIAIYQYHTGQFPPEYFWPPRPSPWLRAHPEWESVDGWFWPLGAELHLTIDDPNTAESPDLEMSKIVDVVSDPPNNYSVWFEFAGVYDLKQGDLVTMTDGTTIRNLVVSSVSINKVNLKIDTVTGTSEPGSVVRLPIPGELFATADRKGKWKADFAAAGLDLVPGMVIAEVYDEDGDLTSFERYAHPLYTGHWRAVDSYDQSNMQLTISGGDNDQYQLTWTDDYWSTCDGSPGIGRGTGIPNSGGFLRVNWVIKCHGVVTWQGQIDYVMDIGTGTLWDGTDTWYLVSGK